MMNSKSSLCKGAFLFAKIGVIVLKHEIPNLNLILFLAAASLPVWERLDACCLNTHRRS